MASRRSAVRAERRRSRLADRLGRARTQGEQLAAVYDYAREVLAVVSRSDPPRGQRLASELTQTLLRVAEAADRT